MLVPSAPCLLLGCSYPARFIRRRARGRISRTAHCFAETKAPSLSKGGGAFLRPGFAGKRLCKIIPPEKPICLDTLSRFGQSGTY